MGQVEGVRGNAGCHAGDSGAGALTVIVVPSAAKNLFSLLLSAQMGGKKVEVYFTSDTLSHGYCTLLYANWRE